jgi:hypothetical protein
MSSLIMSGSSRTMWRRLAKPAPASSIARPHAALYAGPESGLPKLVVVGDGSVFGQLDHDAARVGGFEQASQRARTPRSPGTEFRDRYRLGGQRLELIERGLRKASSRSRSMPTASASAIHTFGGRSGRSENLASASIPTTSPLSRSKIGWKTILNARSSIAAPRARVGAAGSEMRRVAPGCARAGRGDRHGQALGTLVLPSTVRWIADRISSVESPLHHVATAPARSIVRTVETSS